MPGNYNWRPNDNSPSTNLRYKLEANKWMDALRSAEAIAPKPNYRSDLGFIAALIQIPLLLLFIILMIPILLIKEIFPGAEKTGPILTQREKFDARMEYLNKKYPSKKKKRTSTWEDLPVEKQEMVKFVRAQTAKAKAEVNSH